MATRRETTSNTSSDDTLDGEWRTPIAEKGLTLAQATAQTDELQISDKIKLLLSNSATESVQLKLSRIDPKNGTLGYCCNYTVEEWEADEPMDMIRSNWGPGKYELHIIGAAGSLGRPRFTIAQPFAMVNPPQQNPITPNSDNAIAQALQSIAHMILQGQQQTAQLIQAMAPQPRDELKELEKLALMKKIFSSDAPAQQNNSLSAITEIMSAMKAMKEFSGELNPPAQVDADNPMSMIPTLLDTIKSFAGKGQPQQPQEIQPLQIPQSFEQQSPQNQHQPQPNPGDMILKGATQKIVELATKNADPKEGGQFIFDALPDELLPYLAYPNWFEILSSFAPELKPHQAWVTQAKAHADTLFAAQNAG